MAMRVGVLLLAAWILSGCALGVSHPRALQPVSGFAPLAGDPRVWVEPGYEAYGERVSQALPAAIARVEAAHYLPFLRPPRVHVCGTADCFARHVLTPRLSAAVVPDNRLFLSPNLDGKEQHRLGPLLAHELSHLHLGQRIGHYHSTLPVWFHEGWASLAAEGGGAEYASDEKVLEAMRAGRRVNLDARDTPDRRHRAAAYNLDIHSFYRQSMLLVRWLRDQDEAKFRALVTALQDNADFVIAFADVYGTSPTTHFTAFYDAVLGDNGAVQAAPSTP
jgi:hypothetical protein